MIHKEVGRQVGRQVAATHLPCERDREESEREEKFWKTKFLTSQLCKRDVTLLYKLAAATTSNVL